MDTAGPRLRIIAILFAVSLAELLVAACGDGDTAATRTPALTDPSGIVEVDEIAFALEQRDLPALLERVTYLQEQCSLNPEVDPASLYRPPRCPEGTDDGAPVDVIITGTCEVGPTLPEAVEGELRNRAIEPARQVFAVVGPSSVFRWEMDYALILAPLGQPNAPFSSVIGIADGGIMLAASWCGSVSEAARSLSRDSEVVYVHPDVNLATPIPSQP